MANSGGTTINPATNLWFKFSWETASVDVYNYTSTINWRVQMITGDNISISDTMWKDYTITVAGNKHTGQVKFGSVPSNFTSTIKTGTEVIKHNKDGTKTFEYNASINIYLTIDGTTISTVVINGSATLDTIQRQAIINTAPDFNDEENPTITYTNLSGDKVTLLQACISISGGNDDVPYRDIPVNGNSYTFNLTDTERLALTKEFKDQNTSRTVRFYVKTTIDGTTYLDYTERTMTLINYAPTLSPTVQDSNATTVALTGNNKKFIKYYSDLQFTTGAAGSKGATISEQDVTCGSKFKYNVSSGTINAIDGYKAIFKATDSRGFTISKTLDLDIINYVKPTCYVKSLQMSSDGSLDFTISGNSFNQSFGAKNNTLSFRIGYSQNGGDITWKSFTASPSRSGSTYTLTHTLTGFDYTKEYDCIFEVSDELSSAQSIQRKVGSVSIFDWGKDDFNFNVPVNIEADALSIYGDQVLTHVTDTTIAATNGSIYLRPKGIDNATAQTKFSPTLVSFGTQIRGSVAFFSKVNASGGVNINGNAIEDFVIEQGSASMGSNGTWYWHKWLSGKAECWGCRNYGKIAITTAWGNLYRSETFAQDLPSGLFARTPDVININLVSCDFGGWVCLHESTTPSATTTGGFIVVRPASATTSRTYIGFNIIGEWS